MIKEEKRDLIDRRELYRLMVRKMNEQYQGATLNSALTLREILEIFSEIPVQNELSAVWIFDEGVWKCSWCKMTALESFGKSYFSRCCPYCGRRMKMETENEN